MTENALLGFGNHVDDGEISLSGGACYASLPLSNLLTRDYGAFARFVSTDPAVTWLNFSWPQRRLMRTVAYGPHNIGLRGKARLVLSNAADLSLPVYDSGLIDVWPRAYELGEIPWGSPNWWRGTYTEAQIARLQRPMIFVLPSALTARYGRLTIEDPDNAAGYIQAGRLFAADALQPSRSFIFDAEIGFRDLSEFQRTRSGARIFTELAKPRIVGVQWNTLSQREAMGGFFDMQQQMGTTGECLFVWDPADTANALRSQFFCTLTELNPLRVTNPDIWGVAMPLEELL